MADLISRLARVRGQIAAAADRAGRDPAAVRLIAVTKGRSPDTVAAAWNLGLREFGENRVERAPELIPAVEAAIRGRPGDPEARQPLRWHMIGHVQSRKAEAVVEWFEWVHSVDSLRLAQRLSRFAAEHSQTLPVLLELNVSGEPAKLGFRLHGWPDDRAAWEEFLGQVESIVTLPGLRVEGLMTVAPIGGPDVSRPVFRRLAQICRELHERFPVTGWNHLSMGMSDDFQAAIEEGATMIRLGRALFDD